MGHAFSKILILITLIVLAGGGFFAWQYFGVPKEVVKPSKELADETANWQTYRNEEYGSEIKYPRSWEVESSVTKEIRVKNPTSGSYFTIIENKNERKLTLDEWFKETTIVNGRPNA